VGRVQYFSNAPHIIGGIIPKIKLMPAIKIVANTVIVMRITFLINCKGVFTLNMDAPPFPIDYHRKARFAMKKFLNHRIIAALLVAVLVASSVVSVSATPFNAGFADTESAGQWDSRFDNAVARASTLILTPCCISMGIPISTAPKTVMWRLFDRSVDNSGTGEVSLDRLYDICAVYNGYFNRPVRQSLFGLKDVSDNIASTVFCVCMGFYGSFNFVIEAHPSSGFYRIKETTTGLWVVDSKGQYPYCNGSTGAPTSGGNKWVGEHSCSTAAVNMKNYDALNMICSRIKESGTSAQIRVLGTNYKAIWYNRQYYCDPEGRPFVCYANESQAAVNQPRPDTSVTDEDGKPAKDETGTVINNPDNSTNIDLSGMTITLPNGDVQVADAVIYDESTKTYYIDSHDTTNNYVTYNYSWTYNINYTSITYIGQTEQYDKYYKVYYELPDGRDSADLTPEDLEQLNVSVDCIGYARSADDVALRSLYHFDGDTRDSSYWNYCTNFKWNTGASLTYMDAGVFNGALYLDETSHDFTITLPSAIGSGDYSLQFRYYQSKTAAPQTDSYIMVGGLKAFQFNGGAFLNGSGTSLSQTPTGTWNEIALIRKSGTLYYYLNGVKIGSIAQSTTLTNALQFVFGSAQQTYKYFDELRFTNYALTTASNYTCTSVPYDTNLSLVLPNSVTPIADEYVSWTNSTDLVKTYDFCQTSLPFVSTVPINTTYPSNSFIFAPTGQYYNCSLVPATSGTNLFFTSTPVNGSYYDNPGLYFYPRKSGLAAGSYDIIIYDEAYNSYRFSFSFTDSAVSFNTKAYSKIYAIAVSNSFICFQSNPMISTLTITRVDIVSQGGSASIGNLVTGVVPIPTDQLSKATLAVKTDIAITNRQIGGVRPTYPETGLVWAMVENGVIQSLQIYDGSAWVSCDGRIWTGERWVPYSSYNIITLQDFYDVADASGGSYEYIYTESGFWAWWQKSWNAFTNKLFAALSSAGMDTSGGTSSDGSSKSLWQRIKDAFNDTLGTLIEALFDLIKEVLKTLISSATDMLKFFFSLLTDAVLGVFKSFFDAFKDSSLFDFFKQPPIVGSDGTQTDGGYGLPSEVGTGFAFISGVIMVLPPDLRSILFFSLAAMVLFGVLKLVKA